MEKTLTFLSRSARALWLLYNAKFDEAWDAAEGALESVDAILPRARPTDADANQKLWSFWREAVFFALDDFLRESANDLDLASNEMAVSEALGRFVSQFAPIAPPQDLPDVDELASPASSKRYSKIRKAFPKLLTELDPKFDTTRDDEMLLRLDRAIEHGSERVWATGSEYYEPIIGLMTGPVSEGVRRRRQYSAHNDWMRKRFRRMPLWGQENTGITLSDLYVPLRGYRRLRKEKDGDRRFGESPEYQARIFDLYAETLDWLERSESHDDLTIIGGGPGSGKSSFARALGAKMTDSQDWRVIFVEVQGMDAIENLRSKIGAQLRDRGTGFKDNPLEWDRDRPNLLLILDGLDELTQPGPEAQRVMENFIRGIEKILTDSRAAGDRTRALLLGRPSAARDALERAGGGESRLVNVLPMAPVDHNDARVKVDDLDDPHKLAGDDQREDYWERYCAAKCLPSGAPCLLADPRFGELSHMSQCSPIC